MQQICPLKAFALPIVEPGRFIRYAKMKFDESFKTMHLIQ